MKRTTVAVAAAGLSTAASAVAVMAAATAVVAAVAAVFGERWAKYASEGRLGDTVANTAERTRRAVEWVEARRDQVRGDSP